MFAAFRSRNYTLFWTGSFISSVGTWMQSIALGWLVYEITGSAAWLGAISFAANAPSLVVGLIGGAMADRADRKTTLVGTQIAAALAAFGLSALTRFGAPRLSEIVAIALFTGIAMAIYLPVVQATIPSLVPVEDLLNAISLNAVQFNLARTIGPIAAGASYAAIGPAGCFFLNGVSFLVLAVAFSRLRLPPQAIPPPSSIWRQLSDGLRYAASVRLIVTMLGLASAISLFGFPYIVLMPAVARDHLATGSAGLGMLMGAVGTGAVVGGLGLAWIGDVARKAMVAIGAGSLFAGALVAFSLARSMSAALPTLFLLGVVQVICIASANTTLQVSVANAMRGRVMSMLTLALFGLSTLGSVLLGVIGDRLGVEIALRLGGVAILLSVVALAVACPEIFEPVGGGVVGERPAPGLRPG